MIGVFFHCTFCDLQNNLGTYGAQFINPVNLSFVQIDYICNPAMQTIIEPWSKLQKS